MSPRRVAHVAEARRDGAEGGNKHQRDDPDIFLTKIAADGSVHWALEAGGLRVDEGRAVAARNGSVYVTGLFNSEAATFGDLPVLDAAGGSDVFVYKVDALGTSMWAIAAGGDYNDAGRGIALDVYGDAYITGSFNQSATFGIGTSAVMLHTAGNLDTDSFLMKVWHTGTVDFALQSGGQGIDKVGRDPSRRPCNVCLRV
ncbi:hypothetical protein CYMTET_15093 [Cymbomonas tetramitiformis]|uniref:Uncharacterized protein n=1 Tax=Cymbomonas tetramitiformis TaxID=36881 RepID=A0AAE0GF20_9CHLO|nr:hypothetical protein CYMTET_15093 [Cymbomonas tetramitiformis]